MFTIAKGYPLGMEKDKYIVECNNELNKLSLKKTAVWMSFNGVKEVVDLKDDKLLYQELLNEGLLVQGETIGDLFSLLQDATLVRQGAGTLSNGKDAICLGEKAICPSEPYLDIWKLANGKRNAAQIYQVISKKYGLMEETFMSLVNYLDENDLIFIF